MSIKIKIYRQKSIESADFSAQEPRVMSSLSGERDLIDGYNLRTKEFPKGKDFYAMLASSAFGKDYWECTEFDQNGNFQQEGKNRRLAGKVIQLGVSYGMGAKLLAEGLNKKKQPGEALMTIDGAREMMDTFFGKFVALREWKDYNSERLETFGYMETALGRRRRLFDVWLPDYETKVFKTEEFEDVFFNIPNSVLVRNYNEEKVVARKFSKKSKFDQKKYAEEIDDNPEYFPKSNGGFKSRPRTQASNFVIQGGSAELTKRAMVSIYTHPDKKRLGLNLLAPVHDEILVEGYTEYREEALKALSTCMSNSASGIYEVSMICDGVIETCWNLIHFTDKIKKEYKKNGQNFNEILENYEEIDPDCLRRIVDGDFDPETDVLVPKKNS